MRRLCTAIATAVTVLIPSMGLGQGLEALLIAGPVANAGPNQTARVGQTVTLDGSGSSNPSGIGTLTYRWQLTSRPPGTATVLMNDSTVRPSFVVDAPGNYVISLTVSNGVDSSSASVTVSTTNTAPVANAGPNQTVALVSTVILNGSGSFDVDGNSLTYQWSLIAVPAGSTAALVGATNVSPTFVADRAGQYVAQLVVNDGLTNSSPASVTVTTQNSPPVANAGAAQVVRVGALVQLNGSGSTDVDGDSLSYQWSLNTRPSGSTATLSNATAVNPTFTADLDGTYVAQLIVNDGHFASNPATVSITTNAVQPPAANAGADQTVLQNTIVTLNGSGTDPQGLALTFQWALISRPASSTAALSSASIPSPTFFTDLAGIYVAQLIVNNGYLNSAASLVTITTVSNTAPVANAGANQSVILGATVTLDGSGSSDADGNPLTYSWSFLSRPAGSAAVLTGPTTVRPTFVVDVAGMYVAQLIVNDGFNNSAPATVVISTERLSLAPNPLNLTNAPGTLTVTLSVPAGPGGQLVRLASFDPTVATIPATLTIPAGATSGNATVTGITSGSTNILATALGFSNALATVNVDMSGVPPATMVFSPLSLTITTLSTQNLTLNLSAPAPVGGLTVNVSSDNTNVATVPAAVTFTPGATTVLVPVTGVNGGSATIHASALGFSDTTASVTVVNAGWIQLPAGVTVAVGEFANFPYDLLASAPPLGAFITFTSSDTSKATVVPQNVLVPEGATHSNVVPKIFGISPGQVTITATAYGFPDVSQVVQVTPTP